MKEIQKLKPFTKFCCSIGAIPSSYLISMTYEEQLLWLCDYLKNTIIPTIDNNGQAVTELQQLYTQLKNYVDKYFDNLDVQDEINNKLDEMAESGELQEIITNYLKIKGILSFDTVQDMKNSKNLVEGSFAETFGFNNLNDGGSKKYKIKKIVSATGVNEFNRINLGRDDLYAEPINNDLINVKEFGVYGDGVHDDTLRIQELINTYGQHTLYFPKGNYLISAILELPAVNNKMVNFYLDKNARIFSNIKLTCLLKIAPAGESYNKFTKPHTLVINGGIFDCENADYGIIVVYRQLTEIKNAEFTNISNVGICLGLTNASEILVGNTDLHNCYFQGQGSELESTAIVVNSSDNQIYNIVIDRTKHGVVCKGWSNYFNNVHPTAMFSTTPTTEQRNNCVAFDFITGSSNVLDFCYADTYGIAFRCNKGSLILNQCKTYWYYSDDNTSYSCVKYTDFTPYFTKLHLTNCEFDLPSKGTNHHIITNNNDYLENNEFSFVNCMFNYNDTIPRNDPAYCVQANNKTSVNCDKQDRTTLSGGPSTYYPIAILSGNYSMFDYNIQVTWNNYIHIVHKLTSLLKKTVYRGGVPFNISVIRQNDIYYLCVSTSVTTEHKNFVLSHITNNRNCKIFAREDLFTNVSFSNVQSSDIMFTTSMTE